MPAEIVIDTLADHARRYHLHARCPACQHHVKLNAMQIAQAVGWDTPLSVIHAALRCSRCGSGGAELRIIHDGRPSFRCGCC